MNAEELKLCPFCGGTPHLRHYQDEDLWTHSIVTWTNVQCTNCDIGFSWPPNADPGAIQQWNSRPTEQQARRKALERAAIRIRDYLAQVGYGDVSGTVHHMIRALIEREAG